jgi:2-methylcitrate synthase
MSHVFIVSTSLFSLSPSYYLSCCCCHFFQPEDIYVKSIDISLILYAEHGFAASSFACRVTTSTQSDVHSAICAAIGTLRGNLHGGANEAAMELLEKFKTEQEAEKGIREMLAKKQLIMGFGHRIYRKGDPRSDIIKGKGAQRSEATGNTHIHMTLAQ